jgi:hypothetical protein
MTPKDNSLLSIFEHRKPLAPLRPKTIWRPELNYQIAKSKSPELVKAGLYLWNDDLNSCHEIAQENENSDGNYWHAIMHRREGDFSNSLYWYRRVDKNPTIDAMKKKYPTWSPHEFVRWCEEKTKESQELEEMQTWEIKILLNHL